MFEAEITELINKNLPAHVGEVLRKRLERCDELEKEVRAKTVLIEQKDKVIREHEIREHTVQQIAKDRAALDQRIIEHDKKERQFAIDRAVLDALKEANAQRLHDHKEIVLAVFANAKYKYEQVENKTILIPSQGGGAWDKNVTESKRVTTEGAGPTPI